MVLSVLRRTANVLFLVSRERPTRRLRVVNCGLPPSAADLLPMALACVAGIGVVSWLMGLAPVTADLTAKHGPSLTWANKLPCEVAQMILANVDNDADLGRLSQASRQRSLSVHARSAMAARRRWYALLQPDATPDTVLAFFGECNRHLRGYISAGWVRRRLLTGRIALRPQILLLDLVFNVPGGAVSTFRFEAMLRTVALDWGVAKGYAPGVAIRHTSNLNLYSRRHRKRALDALRWLLRHCDSFLTDGRAAAMASFSRRLDYVPSLPVREDASFDEDDPITSTMLQLLPETHRNVVHMVLGQDVAELFDWDNGEDDLVSVLVSYGLDINGVWMDDSNFGWTLLKRSLDLSNFKLACQAIALGASIDDDAGEWWHFVPAVADYPAHVDGLLLFEENVMMYAKDTAQAYLRLMGCFEAWRVGHLSQRTDNNAPTLLEHSLAVLRNRFGARFDARSWKHRAAVKAIGEHRIPVEHLFGIVDKDMIVLLSGVGVSALASLDFCRNTDDLPRILDRIVLNATDAQVQAAITYVDEYGSTVLHKRCMTSRAMEWIQRRAPDGWIWRALTQMNHDGHVCLRLWLQRPVLYDSVPVSVVPILETLAASTNGPMLAYDVGLFACAGSRQLQVELLSSPGAVELYQGHLLQHAVPHTSPHTVLMAIQTGSFSDSIASTLTEMCGLHGAQLFYESYDGLTVMQRAVMTDHMIVDVLMRNAQRLNILYDIIVRQDVAAGWTILHTGAAVLKATVYSMQALGGDGAAWRIWEQRRDSVLTTLLWMVRTLRERLGSLDDFCQLVNARDRERGMAFVQMLIEAASGDTRVNTIVGYCAGICEHTIVHPLTAGVSA